MLLLKRKPRVYGNGYMIPIPKQEVESEAELIVMDRETYEDIIKK